MKKDKLYASRSTPWWKVPPTIDWDIDLPCPYIWFIWWLIVWDRPWGEDGWYLPTNIRIYFQPD